MNKNVLHFPPQLLQVPPLVDDPTVAEKFADNLAGISFSNGNVNMTFATVRADHSKAPASNNRTVTARMVMPLPVAMQLRDTLNQMFGDLEAQGMIKVAPVPPMQ
jgi:glycine cleavage system regulatory protein